MNEAIPHVTPSTVMDDRLRYATRLPTTLLKISITMCARLPQSFVSQSLDRIDEGRHECRVDAGQHADKRQKAEGHEPHFGGYDHAGEEIDLRQLVDQCAQAPADADAADAGKQ